MKIFINLDIENIENNENLIRTKHIIFIGLLIIQSTLAYAQSLAFPEAEGFGRFSKGGRGGDVYHVTNLNDDGAGSLRYGIEEMNGPRTIVFDISGTIMLKDRLKIQDSNLTIAGQTAPGEGITIGNGAFIIAADDIIIRYLRVRLGDQTDGDDDTISITSGENIILDHLTASWSIDETLSCQSDEVDLLTVQWCLVSESLTDSHHEKGQHGYGGIIGSLRQSFHHNLYAHHSSRSPKVTWRHHGKVDFRNNVIYNWGYNNCYDGASSHMNWVNNFYKAGPGTDNDVKHRIFELSDEDVGDFETYETLLYADGNFVDGYPSISNNNWNGGIDFSDGATEAKNRADAAFDYPAINEQSAEVAFDSVVAYSGSSLARDEIDKRIAKEVLTGTTTYTGSKTGNLGIIDSQNDVGGWPALEEILRGSDFDSDRDGMADDWEIENNLNPNNPEDRNNYSLHSDYTNLEVFLNNLTVDDGVLSLDDLTGNLNSQKPVAYPNPTNGYFKLLIPDATGEAEISVYNTQIQQVSNKVYTLINQEAELDLSNVPPGLYFIRVHSMNNETVKIFRK